MLTFQPHRIIGTKGGGKVRRSIAFFVHPHEDLPCNTNLLGSHDNKEDKEKVFRNQALRDVSWEKLVDMSVGDYVNMHFNINYSRK